MSTVKSGLSFLSPDAVTGYISSVNSSVNERTAKLYPSFTFVTPNCNGFPYTASNSVLLVIKTKTA